MALSFWNTQWEAWSETWPLYLGVEQHCRSHCGGPRGAPSPESLQSHLCFTPEETKTQQVQEFTGSHTGGSEGSTEPDWSDVKAQVCCPTAHAPPGKMLPGPPDEAELRANRHCCPLSPEWVLTIGPASSPLSPTPFPHCTAGCPDASGTGGVKSGLSIVDESFLQVRVTWRPTQWG